MRGEERPFCDGGGDIECVHEATEHRDYPGLGEFDLCRDHAEEWDAAAPGWAEEIATGQYEESEESKRLHEGGFVVVAEGEDG